MRETREKEIDGVTFTVEQLPWKDARAVLARLQALIGPALAELAKGGGADVKSLGDLDVGVAAGALSSLAMACTDADLDFLCAKFDPSTKGAVDGGPALPLKANPVFDGHLLRMYQWIWFCCEVNYSDFLGALRSLAPRSLNSKTPSTSPSPGT